MNNLKTLKNILTHRRIEIERCHYPEDSEIMAQMHTVINKVEEELKSEVVKWLKETDKNGMEREFNDEFDFWDYGANTRGWIKHFFNITEEDLKDEKKYR